MIGQMKPIFMVKQWQDPNEAQTGHKTGNGKVERESIGPMHQENQLMQLDEDVLHVIAPVVLAQQLVKEIANKTIKGLEGSQRDGHVTRQNSQA